MRELRNRYRNRCEKTELLGGRTQTLKGYIDEHSMRHREREGVIEFTKKGGEIGK